MCNERQGNVRRIREGSTRKGGVNSPPSTPRPTNPPQGQSTRDSE